MAVKYGMAEYENVKFWKAMNLSKKQPVLFFFFLLFSSTYIMK